MANKVRVGCGFFVCFVVVFVQWVGFFWFVEGESFLYVVFLVFVSE